MSYTIAFFRREYAFEGISEEDADGTTLYPRGPFLVCTVPSLREFIDHFPFLWKPEGLITNKHGVTMHKDALRRYACIPDCTQMLYKFRALDRPRT